MLVVQAWLNTHRNMRISQNDSSSPPHVKSLPILKFSYSKFLASKIKYVKNPKKGVATNLGVRLKRSWN